MPRLLLAFIVTLTVTLIVTLPARAQPDPGRAPEAAIVTVADAERVKPPGLDPRAYRLEVALEDLRDASASSATWGVLSNFLAGAASIGLGTWVLVGHADSDEDASSVAAGSLAIAMGGAWLALAVRGWFARSTDQLRLERWRALRARGLIDDRALARFEGELAAEAEVARWIRTGTGVAYIGVAAAGAGMIGLAAADQVPSASSGLAYFEGGLLVALGLWQSIANLAGSSYTEDIVRRYRESETAARVSLEPHATGAQLRLRARF
jgi:hypothetical protein